MAGGGGVGGVLPVVGYMEWLRPKRVPFSGFRYKYERLGISVVEAGERAGNLSFWSLKGPKFG